MKNLNRLLMKHPMFHNLFKKPANVIERIVAKIVTENAMVKVRAYWSPIAGLLLLSGCAAGPDYVRPATMLPSTYMSGTASVPTSNGSVKNQPDSGIDKNLESQKFIQSDIPAQWWELFQSPALSTLVEASLKQNPTVEAAQAALRGAMENVYAQQGAWFPSVEASFLPTRQKIAGTLASPASSGASYYNLHTAQVSVSYTLDVFGGNRRQIESLQAQAEAQKFQLEASYLTLTSNVVVAAIQEAALRGQIAATKEIIASQTQLMKMIQRQYALGQIAQIDVAAQESALANTEVALPSLEKQLALQRDLLSALAGRLPDGFESQPKSQPKSEPKDKSNNEHTSGLATTIFTLDSLQLPAELPLTLPASLVEHRPDVRAAEEQLHAASAAIGVAVANRLPNISLGVNTYGSAASSISDLFKAGTGFWTLAGNITQPIFDGGTLKHRQGAAQAAYDQAAAQYRATVINAFQNVADALIAIQSDAVALKAAQRAERAAAKSLAIVQRQLALGDISSANVLSSEQAYQQSRLNLVQAQAARLTDTVALFQALGGGWWNRNSATVTKDMAASK
ncbi:TolC family protein [Undibacterium sp. 5I1]|uniref:TolC family protein n=1 Tax=unclassified Undibacterium TaxID=2630295 RepID=UPI002AB5BF95|nr:MULTISPECIES: TolC family protein [unclassified Undibacterium]MDY7536728.1 TolC family protein [Undibacterium sp. 5I1]MEB0230227.1 TolC family protein [Undibacterium sp. 10I3]MEB0257927.1 TolC family protein [Undibacterium sp. 5I1]